MIQTTQIPSQPKRTRGFGYFILLGLCALLGVLVAAGFFVVPSSGHVANGVTFAGAKLGGMTAGQVREVVETKLGDINTRRLTLRAGSSSLSISLPKAGIKADPEATTREALAVGRTGSVVGRLYELVQVRTSGLPLKADIAYDKAQAQRELDSFAKVIDLKPQDASVQWDDGSKAVAITPEHVGGKLDVPASLQLIEQQVLQPLQTGGKTPDALELPYEANPPRVTAEMLRPVDTVLGEFTTSYSTSTRSRASNVERAASLMDGKVLMPGDVFSYNDTVGQRDSKNGFQMAPVIVNGQLQAGMGGGVCQVSTTLYNAVLLSNLQIVSRQPHSLPSHYVSLGRDATVAYGSIDLRFRNSTSTPIVIDTTARSRQLTVRILGQGPAPVVRIIASNHGVTPGRVITKKDPTLPAGQRVIEHKGGSGQSITITREVEVNGVVTRETVSHDRYPGSPTIIRIGTGPANGGASATVMAPQGGSTKPAGNGGGGEIPE